LVTTPFYKKALELFTRTQKAQIQKGLDKYPEPFNPHSWSPDELLNHALEETVDLTHYLVGLKELLDAKDSFIKQQNDEIVGLKYMNKKLEKRVQQLYGELTLAQPPKPVRNLAAEGKFPTLPDLLEDEPLPVIRYSDVDDQY
jgi:hypothetical protein